MTFTLASPAHSSNTIQRSCGVWLADTVVLVTYYNGVKEDRAAQAAATASASGVSLLDTKDIAYRNVRGYALREAPNSPAVTAFVAAMRDLPSTITVKAVATTSTGSKDSFGHPSNRSAIFFTEGVDRDGIISRAAAASQVTVRSVAHHQSDPFVGEGFTWVELDVPEYAPEYNAFLAAVRQDAAVTDARIPAKVDFGWPELTPFVTEVHWLIDSGISTGTCSELGRLNFAPGTPVTREAMAAFLYRAAGSPAFSLPTTPTFSDINTTHPFYTEIEWVAAQRISTGWDDGTFRPSENISREAMSAFLYRYAGSPAVNPASHRFTDVSNTHMFVTEIMWLSSQGVTTGWDDGSFRPSESISREAMAAFLYRMNDKGLLTRP